MLLVGRPDGAHPGECERHPRPCLLQLQEKLRQLLAADEHALATWLASSAHRQWHEDRGSLSPVTGVCAGMAVGHRLVGRPGAKAFSRPLRPLLGPRLPAGERQQ